MSHWGYEYSFYPLPYQMRSARQMIDAGASVILGHGPHYPQGIERYRDGRIVYSLGNFIFDEPHKYANRSFVFGVEIDGSGSGAAAAGLSCSSATSCADARRGRREASARTVD